ncbi:MAG TPA: SAM-dependent methyltransferase [Pseudonocardia sp.]|nr:SAM-dependent methyltransferase [Pseudonocardia sp.]
MTDVRGIDTSVPHSARLWNYLLGGKDNFEVDRAAARQALALLPNLAAEARADRGFLIRSVRFLVRDAGIRQFLDIGTGLPTASNTHEVAQVAAPECRVVYVDNDPLILAHARALLVGSPEGATAYIHGDLRDPDTVLREATRTLDFTRPIGLMLIGVLNFLVDDTEAYRVVQRLVDALPSGSYLAVAHPNADVQSETVAESMRVWNASGAAPITARTGTQIARFFDGLELIEPGVVSSSLWRPDPADVGTAVEVVEYCGLARKP